MDTETINRNIGYQLKNLRKQAGLTQQELADRTELTKGFISQLERGQVSPSIVTLLDLIECLGTTPSDFFKASGQEQIVFQPGECFEKTDSLGNITRWIVPSAQSNQMEPILVSLAPGQQSEPDSPHNGEEFGYILNGRVLIHYGDKKYEAKSGESFYYEADKVHYLENPGSRPARLIWVSTPPSF
ncbi:MAG: cupin domain-containing protein [Clostridia bacterium]|nr:cupin domain-containing protein [Clostridia bacterium]